MKTKELLEWSLTRCNNECNLCKYKKECTNLRRSVNKVSFSLESLATVYNDLRNHLDDELDETKIEMLEHAKELRDYCMSNGTVCFGCVFYKSCNGCKLKSTPEEWDV